jgi:hypothetical protein
MQDRPAEPGCGTCQHGRTCSALRRLANRELGCPTLVDLLTVTAATGTDWRTVLESEE